MLTEFYVIYQKNGSVRFTKRGPPATKAGERFTKVILEAPNELWTPPAPHTVRLAVTKPTSVAPPAEVDLASIPDVCHGRLLPKQTKDSSGKPDVGYACTGCDFSSTWQADKTPHWKFTKVAK